MKVISETLRLANIVNAIWRKATKDVDIKGKSHTYILPLVLNIRPS